MKRKQKISPPSAAFRAAWRDNDNSNRQQGPLRGILTQQGLNPVTLACNPLAAWPVLLYGKRASLVPICTPRTPHGG